MGEFPRKSDGRRVFTVEFKRGVVQQLLKGEKTLAEVSRELDIQPSVARQTAHYATRVRPAGFYRRLDDETVVQQIRGVTAGRVFPDATRHRLSPEHVVAHGFQSCRRHRSISTTVQVPVRY